MTLSDYLLREVRQLTERPTNRELFERAMRENPWSSIRRPRSSSGRCAASDRRRRLGRTSPGGRGPGSEPLWKRVTAPETTLHVPHLFDVEVLHGLRRSALRGLMADALARAVALLQELQAVGIPTTACSATYAAAAVSAYDGAYCALARALDAPLVTLDDLARSGPGASARAPARGLTRVTAPRPTPACGRPRTGAGASTGRAAGAR